MGCPFLLVLLLVLVLDSAVTSKGRPILIFRGWNQRVSGFPIVLLLLEGLRCISRKVNSLPAKPLGGRTDLSSKKWTGRCLGLLGFCQLKVVSQFGDRGRPAERCAKAVQGRSRHKRPAPHRASSKGPLHLFRFSLEPLWLRAER